MSRVEVEVPHGLAGERIDRVVAMVCDVPRRVASDLIDAGEVRIDGAVVTRRSERVDAGQVLDVDVPERADAVLPEPDPMVEFGVVHEDDDVVVVDKPAGLVVHPGAGNPTGTLVHGLLARYPSLSQIGEPLRPGIVHRLDRDTSGLLVVARTEPAREALIDALRARAVTRQYHTLVWGHIDEPRGLIDAPIGRSPKDPTKMAVVVGGREARTSYEVVRRYDQPVATTELRCELETGRTHQIRVHLRALDHPVVGDSRYGGDRASLASPRQFLHAERLAFRHPTTGELLQFESALPGDLAGVLASLDADDGPQG